MAERRGLGRGLSALLDETQAASTPEGRRASGVLEIPVDLIGANPEQPRRRFDEAELDQLAGSIAERGVIQPILVRRAPDAPGTYQIVAGERRWRAAQKAGLRDIPALVRDLDDREVMEVALIENIQRADLNPLEEARGYEALRAGHGRSAESIAVAVGKSRSLVANTLSLLRLPAALKSHVEAGALSAGHARALLDLAEAESLAAEVVRRGLSVRQTEALARKAKAPPSAAGKRDPGRASPNADIAALEADLSGVLGLTVEIQHRRGSGQVRIAYRTLEQLDDLCRRLTRPG